MPQTISLGAFVLGAVLLLVGLVGGRFKIFSAEVESSAGKLARTIATILGICLVGFGLMRETGFLNGALAEGNPGPDTTARPHGAGGSGSTDIGDHPTTPPPAVREEPDIAGYWHDDLGTQFQITQQGASVVFSSMNPNGTQSRGSGMLRGNQIHLDFETNIPSSGNGDAVVSPDGRQISGTYYDSALGRYSWTIYRD
ncbi:MAG TPA: hypothetical protein VHI13_03570 [Candidatus Kapabacteria bacterium]|nr:hypothetical protein [Candidatus Kapabacteria bacterium]